MRYNVWIPESWEQSTLVTVLTSWYYGPLLTSMQRHPEQEPTSASAREWGWQVEDTLVPMPQNGDTCGRYDLSITRVADGPGMAGGPDTRVCLEDALKDIRSRVFWRGRANRCVRTCSWQNVVFSRTRISASLILFFP